MKHFAIASRSESHHKFEISRILDEATELFDEAKIFDPISVSYIFEYGYQQPKLFLNHDILNKIDTLHIRSTGQRENSITLLCHTLDFCNTNLTDPLVRFNLGKASKILSTFKRFSKGVGSSSFISFGKKNAEVILNHWEFPFIYKPVSGRQGIGILKIECLDDFNNIIEEHFERKEQDDNPILLQKYYHFLHEYRVVVIDGKLIGAAEKIQPNKNKIQKNFYQGAYFKKADKDKFEEFVTKCELENGLYGLDIGELENGIFHLIENNRSPKFEEFEKATKINLAQEIVKNELEKYDAQHCIKRQ